MDAEPRRVWLDSSIVPKTAVEYIRRDLVNALVKSLIDVTDDLEIMIGESYRGTEGYPSMDRKKNRDMETVLKAREVLLAVTISIFNDGKEP